MIAIRPKQLKFALTIAFPIFIFNPLAVVAQPVETEQNGIKPGLETHLPPGPPPSSNSAPQSELLSLPRGRAKIFAKPHIDVLTYHYDNNRSGWNFNEADLTPQTVASPQFSLLKTLSVDGNVFAQPLLVSNFAMPDGQEHDLLIIATGHNTIYAYDATTFAVLWQVNLGQAQHFSDVRCSDVQPEYGISSTPVIVRKSEQSATLYVVSATEPQTSDFHSFIHAIDLKTGKDIVSPKEIAPSDTLKDGTKLTFNPKNQWSRAGLAYNNGAIYVSIGSHCDNDAAKISGWLLKYSENLDLTASFHTISMPKGLGLSSIWMTGFAPAIDDAGNLFVVTGNGDFSPPDDYGESVLKLDGQTLQLIDYFTPANYSILNHRDLDFGSGGVTLLSADIAGTKKSFPVAMGKDPVLYLLDPGNLGKNQTNNAGAIQSLPVKQCTVSAQCRGVWGGLAAFQSQSGTILYAQAEHDVLRSYLVGGTSKPSLTASSVAGTTNAGYGGSIPIVSSNGGADGVVWLLRRSAPIELEAYDANTLGAPLSSANIGDWSNPGYGNSFLTPMVANGRVYAAGYKIVKVFGLATEGMTPMSRASQSVR